MSNANYNDIFTTTIENRSKKLADNITKNNALLSRLSAKGKIRPIDGGSKILEELIQISYYHSFVIVDNIHDNIKFFLKIKERLSKHKWIKALYLSRYYKTFDEEYEESIYDKIGEIKYYRIDQNENLTENLILHPKIITIRRNFQEKKNLESMKNKSLYYKQHDQVFTIN